MGISIGLNSVSVSIGGATVLDRLTLDLDPGKIVSIVGMSGCGKTTLLKLIAGVQNPASSVTGSLLYSGRVCPDPCGEFTISLVFQKPYLFPWATARRNVELHRRVRPRESGFEDVDSALDLVGMTAHNQKLPDQLSGGMQQRVALAREFVRRPDVLLLDEPFSNLDYITKEQLHHHLMDFCMTVNPTTIFVTHDPLDAILVADEVVVLKNGSIANGGRLRIDFERPRNSSIFSSSKFQSALQWIRTELN
jgi:ABC-type nitrate/sulfonate/bicarbonate transport system ATPase subunit